MTLPSSIYAFHIPKLSVNLLSVSQLTDHGCLISFDASSCTVQDPSDWSWPHTNHYRRNGVFLMDYLHLLTLLLLLPVSLPPLVVLKLGIDEDICAVTYFTSY